jgi:hypothetical protein
MHTIMDDECIHSKIESKVCLECGLCMENIDYQPEYSSKTTSFVPRRFLRYSIQNGNRAINESIDKVLIPLSLGHYKKQINEMVKATKFAFRLKTVDKIVLSLYNLLKNHSFPISISDLLKYTTLKKHKFLKIYRSTFSFIQSDKSYLLGIYERTKHFITNYNISNKTKVEINASFEEYWSIQQLLVQSDPKDVCLAYFLRNHRKVKEITKISDEYNNFKINHIKSKIKNFELKQIETEFN